MDLTVDEVMQFLYEERSESMWISVERFYKRMNIRTFIRCNCQTPGCPNQSDLIPAESTLFPINFCNRCRDEDIEDLGIYEVIVANHDNNPKVYSHGF